jgi:pimeloyl-ACP methyl ester carboxylesterase
VNALVARLGVAQVDWIGTSMGGLLGMMLAASPGSPVRRLVMNDVGAFLPMDALQYIGRNLRAADRFASRDEVEAHLRHTHREWGSLTPAQWKHLALHGARALEDGGFRLHYDPAIARLVQPAMPFAPGLFFWDAWYKVRCPVLLVRGEDSQVFPSSVATTMRQVHGDTQLVEVAGCGHAPALMSETQIAPIREFLALPMAQRERRRMSVSTSRGALPWSSRPSNPLSARSPRKSTSSW